MLRTNKQTRKPPDIYSAMAVLRLSIIFLAIYWTSVDICSAQCQTGSTENNAASFQTQLDFLLSPNTQVLTSASGTFGRTYPSTGEFCVWEIKVYKAYMKYQKNVVN